MVSLIKREEKGQTENDSRGEKKKKKKKNGKQKTHYYLKYSSRRNPRQKYLGTRIPKDVDRQLADFGLECYRADKGILLEEIRQNYSKHTKSADKKIIQDEIHGFKITHTYSTQKIEGSTMTLGQTRKLLETGLSPKDTPIEDIIEAQQIAELFDEMLETGREITRELVLDWHNKLFQRTDTNNAGEFRRQDVQPYLGETEYVLWYDVSGKISGLIEWYNREKKAMNPVELSAIFHKRFETIHPFIDGNGRVGRMLMIFILHKNGYPMSDIKPKERQTYISKLESSYIKNNEMMFVKWFVSKYLRDHKRFLNNPDDG